METNDLSPVRNLTEEECWDLLISSSFGRLALSIAGEPDIYPVNFIAVDKTLLFRTAEGTKLLELTVNNRVAFETDGIGRDEAWSVVARGQARVLDTQAEIEAADQLPLRPLVPTLKYIYVEITPTTVSGRRFNLGPEPDRY
ncbi:pyridoxamine 5'-phosphate oxidase family protein [Cryobacterium sp. TMT1-21]|uniref:Pyridoxamine 5'-phosphate oxidase family protein n=1 Tax=Cryobacterium shii TaxID=1259235 RepID=A0AAQ2C872_9MICO|nr:MULTISPECIES: pyridoxamine 5'-phosphate oxidase family protein [Cryobacterium]TFC51290.1 pyridoxamine 5'-phosphate oxidase family protein [Cryobacterium shii]TFC85197.1 pyridoxamine 5'-phosphate oxidase family protein [Cryobacterium sp. TmT2-59]TFD13118.1 pyridoxamine 5'-phosphate oxidase family protein [Cryobacterium sp. TMT1-21]TFD20556.1 pyridoxamine 5'-phosphate oxidase family protein [Cryobacterium sp. TMT4-10]TFD26210.1 pyridoxamine 5'-phosphate oxidase family protein [Cryobacterium s